jgi:transposase
MRLSLDALPRDVDVLHQLVRDLASAMDESRVEVDRLRLIIKQFQRAQFGGRSEKLDTDQFRLGLEDLDADLARAEARRPAPEPEPEPDRADAKPHRAPLPEHLPRSETVLDVSHDACPDCGRKMHAASETISEMLDWVPAQFQVLRIRRPKWACTDCGTLRQAPAPERAIGKGLATPALLAHVLVNRYCEHTPLFRQAQIFARHGVEISRSTLSGWVGGACWWLEPLRDRLAAHVLAGERIFGDDTPLPVLDPGRGRTKTGRLWAYARDDRPWAGRAPPAVVYFMNPIAKPNVRQRICQGSRAFCRPMDTRGLRSWRATASCWRLAGYTRVANSMSSTKRPSLPWRAKRYSASQSSTKSKPKSDVGHPRSALPSEPPSPHHASRPCTPG